MTARPARSPSPVCASICNPAAPRPCCIAVGGFLAGLLAGALAVLAVFLVLALFDLLPLLPGLVHAAILLAFGAGFLLAVGVAFREIVRARRHCCPAPHRARERTVSSSVAGARPTGRARPLDPQATQLWDAHRQRMQALVRRLRIGAADRRALRARPVGLAGGADDTAVDRGDRCRERLARPPDTRSDPERGRRDARDRRQPRHLDHPARIHRAAAAIPAPGKPADDRRADRQHAARSGAWRGFGPASGDRREQPRLRHDRQAGLSSPSDLECR